jgi:trans-aconitate methyltransferase
VIQIEEMIVRGERCHADVEEIVMKFDWDGAKYSTISDLQAEVGHMLIDALHLQAYEKVLDLGCGIGNLTVALALQCHEGFVLGIDASSSMISQAQMRTAGVANIEFRAQNAEDIQFQREFDVVFSNSALHWLGEGDKVLASIRMALKPGGRVGLQFPLLNERHPLIASVRQVIQNLGFERYYEEWKFPWFVTTVRDYTKLLCNSGYQNVVVEVMQTAFRFESPSQAYDFFDAVGLGLYLAPLAVEQAQRFRQELHQELERANTSDGILFHFERLFAFGSVS